MLEQNQQIVAEIFRTSSPWKLETFTQNFWSSGFFGTWSLESSSLECWRRSIRTFVFRNFKHLIRSIIFRGWDLFIRTFCPESSEASWQIFRTVPLAARVRKV